MQKVKDLLTIDHLDINAPDSFNVCEHFDLSFFIYLLVYDIKQSPLHFCCSFGYMECTKLLLEDARINPNKHTDANETPIHYAMKNGHFNIFELLLNDSRTELKTGRYKYVTLFQNGPKSCPEQGKIFKKILENSEKFELVCFFLHFF